MIVGRGPRRPHRPQLRLPGAQGDPQGRRLGAARTSGTCCARSCARRSATPGDLPVTMKMRKGIDDDHLTYLDAGRIAVEEGVTAIALHGRTAAQHYGGTADWDAIARLKEHVPEIPVLGNGDIWSRRRRAADGARDRLRRRRRRPRLPGPAVAVRRPGRAPSRAAPAPRARPTLREVAGVMRPARRAARRVDRRRGARRHRLPQARAPGTSRASRSAPRCASGWRWPPRWPSCDALLGELDLDQPWPAGADGPRGRTSGATGSCCRTAGWRTRTTARASARTPSWTRPAADVATRELGPSGLRSGGVIRRRHALIGPVIRSG